MIFLAADLSNLCENVLLFSGVASNLYVRGGAIFRRKAPEKIGVVPPNAFHTMAPISLCSGGSLVAFYTILLMHVSVSENKGVRRISFHKTTSRTIYVYLSTYFLLFRSVSFVRFPLIAIFRQHRI